MKRTGFFTAIVIMVAVAQAVAGWIIEEVATDSRGEQSKPVFYIQDNKMMIDEKEDVIFDLEKGEMYAIMHEQKAYMKITSEMMGMGGGMQEWSGNLEVKKTSETETIAGYKATKYDVMVDGTLKDEIWIAEDVEINKEYDQDKFHQMVEMRTGGGSYESSQAYRELFMRGYPLKHVHYSSDGPETTIVTKVTKTDIPDSQFKVPNGYVEMDMMQMMQGR